MTRNRITEALESALAAAATAATGRTWAAQPTSGSTGPTGAADATSLPIALNLAGALNGKLVLRIAEAEAGLLSPSAPADQLPALLAKLADSAAQQIERALALSVGQTSVTVLASASPADQLETVARIVLRAADEYTPVNLLCTADRTLAAQLQQAAPAPTADPAAAAPPARTPRRAPTMDRVVDVPLAVTLRFGQRQLLLRELLELSSGSLLELDRQVEEAVDLMLGDRVIARGEVVIVDGNYGMRVTEVLEHATRSAAKDRLEPLSYQSA